MACLRPRNSLLSPTVQEKTNRNQGLPSSEPRIEVLHAKLLIIPRISRSAMTAYFGKQILSRLLAYRPIGPILRMNASNKKKASDKTVQCL